VIRYQFSLLNFNSYTNFHSLDFTFICNCPFKNTKSRSHCTYSKQGRSKLRQSVTTNPRRLKSSPVLLWEPQNSMSVNSLQPFIVQLCFCATNVTLTSVSVRIFGSTTECGMSHPTFNYPNIIKIITGIQLIWARHIIMIECVAPSEKLTFKL